MQQFFVVYTNVLGGCYGSTGPSSVDHAPGEPYATRFPVISIFETVRAQFALLDHLGIEKLYASVGSSMGGAMQSLASGWIFPKHVGKAVSISGAARSSPLNHRASPHGTRNAVYVFIVGCSIRSVVTRHHRTCSPYGGSKLEDPILLQRPAATYATTYWSQTRAS
jgi:pimeloyl-ACP methyl ester carboxylesterase